MNNLLWIGKGVGLATTYVVRNIWLWVKKDTGIKT